MGIVDNVARLYETYPYPNYPLLAKPQWEQGYLSSSRFAQRVASISQDRTSSVLIVGCGEALPYVIRKWENANVQIACVDLSRRNIKRAKLRTLFSTNISFATMDVDHFLVKNVAGYNHMDVYGVLHHLTSPTRTLEKLGANLSSGGTMRLMVYNGQARQWIHHLQRAFQALHLNPYETRDLKRAKLLLKHLGRQSESARRNIEAIGPATIKNNSRFVDTFFHAREVRYSCKEWLQMISNAGFKVEGLYDRYGELDDLENPMWTPPKQDCLDERSMDLRFENNLELYLSKDMLPSSTTPDPLPLDLKAYFKSPPASWFSFEETKEINWRWRLYFWHKFLQANAFKLATIDEAAQHLPTKALQRLARLGAIMPDQIASKELRQKLNAPLHSHMEAPTRLPPMELHGTKIADLVSQILIAKDCFGHRRLDAVLKRLSQV
jgi:2-polyprenyl-3-methyl-5-hydroxy-6-metoxy-1,4-benzoquinol methylase